MQPVSQRRAPVAEPHNCNTAPRFLLFQVVRRGLTLVLTEWYGKTKGAAMATKAATAARKTAARKPRSKAGPKVELVSSTLSYEGPLFSVYTDQTVEDGRSITRDVIRHNGSVVILAIDDSSKRDPLIVMEHQYRHAANEYLLEVPAGKMEKGEDALAGAKRELLEETGFRAKRWRKMTRYFASPGFLGEWMQVFLAEGLIAGEAQPEYDEQLQVELMPLSKLLAMIDKGQVHDGKTLISVMLFERSRSLARHKRKVTKVAAAKNR
jgi:ADP-ribose pyrophosphatase